jgi:hypothetical protein
VRAPLAILIPALAACLGSAARAGAEGALEIWAPAAPESESPLPLVEVRGQAGARPPGGHDVVIAVDVSDSSVASSGHDLDGDGQGGRTSPALLARLGSAGADAASLKRFAELDVEDSVLYAELAAAEALIARLDPRSFRIGIVAFSDHARVVAPFGSRPERLRAALASLRVDFWRDLRGTNFAEAVRVSLAELRPPPSGLDAPGPGRAERAPAPAGREASILLLSDGAPTLPVHGSRPQQFSIEAAQDAALAGVRVYTYALGTEAEPALDVYKAMAEVSGGRFERIERPGDAIARLRRVDLAGLAELRIENVTSGQPARAQRIFPDGSFDGFVPLEAGANRIRVTAVAADGSRAALERVVVRRPDVAEGPAGAALREQQRALLDELRRRTREVELWAEVERGRTVQLRELELEAEPPPSPPAPEQ